MEPTIEMLGKELEAVKAYATTVQAELGHARWDNARLVAENKKLGEQLTARIAHCNMLEARLNAHTETTFEQAEPVSTARPLLMRRFCFLCQSEQEYGTWGCTACQRRMAAQRDAQQLGARSLGKKPEGGG